MPCETYTDVYDGFVWKEFSSNLVGLSLPSQTTCLMLNIDWINPYEETSYSAGVIYFVIQNLPRSERFKFENVILVGIIPGPNEPRRHMNSFLSPIVDDVQRLYTGITISNPNSFVEQLYFVQYSHVYHVICLQPGRFVDSIVFLPSIVAQNA